MYNKNNYLKRLRRGVLARQLWLRREKNWLFCTSNSSTSPVWSERCYEPSWGVGETFGHKNEPRILKPYCAKRAKDIKKEKGKQCLASSGANDVQTQIFNNSAALAGCASAKTSGTNTAVSKHTMKKHKSSQVRVSRYIQRIRFISLSFALKCSWMRNWFLTVLLVYLPPERAVPTEYCCCFF